MSKKTITKSPKVINLPVQKEQQPQVPQAVTPDIMLSIAVAKGADLAYIKELMQLQKDWLAQKAEREFFQAFSDFQSLVPELRKTGHAKIQYNKKDGSKGEMSYKHDDIGALKAAIREPLSSSGLSQTWKEWEADGKIYVACVIQHSGGYKQIGEPLSANADSTGSKNDIQAKGSTLTYLRRYTLTGMLGLSSSDDDGHGSEGKSPKDDGTDLPGLNENQFKNLCSRVINEKWTMETVLLKCTLNEDQRTAIETIIKSRV
jgi:hypothetical protein